MTKSELVARISRVAIGFVSGVVLTAAIFISQPTEVDVRFDQLRAMGFKGGVSEPGLDHIRVTITNGDRICSARMYYTSGYNVWTAKDEDNNFIQQERITPEDLKEFLNC